MHVIMKRILITGLVAISILSSCKKGGFLEDRTSSTVTEEMVFSDSARTMNFLVRIYQDAGFSFFKGRWDSHGNTEQATDDAEYAYSGVGQKAVILYNGTVSPSNFPFSEFWNLPYTNFRRVNLLLSKLPTTPLSPALQTRVAGEARFLRAWYYTQLLVCFGGVPMVGDNVYGISDIINLPRTNFAECVEYVVKELDEAAAVLPAPAEYAEENYGRITKGACLALKSRLLLYAASPLFNGGSTATDANLAAVVSYPTYSRDHWQRAADAAQAVINTNYYSLNVDNTTRPGNGFYNVFLKRVNNEYIFAFHRAANRDMEGFYNPPSRGGAKNSQPTHQLAEAFPMKNGLPISDPASLYNPANPYANRDPRFYYTIIHNGAEYFLNSASAKRVVNTYRGAATDGYTTNGTGPTTTGYYVRKMCDENISANSSLNTERGWPLIRYAEILLNYAEAINEADQTALAYDKLKLIRERAGIEPGTDGLYGMKANMTKEEMRAFIQNERRIELAFEDHRWHDIRRWKIAMDVNNGFNKAIDIVQGANNTFTYNVVNTIRRHNFRPEMHLLPIPDAEIRKMPAMVQNPGW